MTQEQLVAAFINGLLQVLICNTKRLRDPETDEPLTYDLLVRKCTGLISPECSQENIEWNLMVGREVAADSDLWKNLPELLVNTKDDESKRVALIEANQRMKEEGLGSLDLTGAFNQMRTSKESYKVRLDQVLATLSTS